MNKIGFNVLAWSAVVSDELLPIVDRLKEIGYDGVEFYLGAEPASAYKKLGDHCRDIGLEVTNVFTLSAEENLIAESESVRNNGLDRIKWAIDRCHDMTAKVLCGPYHSAFATFASKAPTEDEYSRSAEVLNAAGDHAAQADVVMTVEALNRFECYLCNTMDQLSHLVQKADHPQVKAMYDTHHANIEEKKVGEAIKTIAPHLRHFHISENDRGTPGAGHVHWDETFATLAEIDYQGWYTIEGFTRNDPDFANAINVWREFAQPWDMAEQGLKFIQEMVNKHAS
ncbi:MAG: sugar phosphate isomerase/epimerase family protein [Cyclobacteriaceae bacterium]